MKKILKNNEHFTIVKNGQEINLDEFRTINTTYRELVTLRDNSNLVPGQWYRITDFVTTVSKNNTKSAGHPFDIIVMADSVNTLNENAHAAQHDRDTYFNDQYLESWEVKYSLDNNKRRFDWALSAEGEIMLDNHIWYTRTPESDSPGSLHPYAWKKGSTIAYTSNNPESSAIIGNLAYSEPDNNSTWGTIEDYQIGKGVIYYLKDQRYNECFYDFKNVQYLDTTNDIFKYTFTYNSGGEKADATLTSNAVYNVIKPSVIPLSLNNIHCWGSGPAFSYISIGASSSNINIYDFNSHISIGESCNNINITSYNQNINIEDYCSHITLGSITTNTKIETGNKYITLKATDGIIQYPTQSIRNITIAKGTNTTSTLKTIIHETVDDNFSTVYQNPNSVIVNVDLS